GYTWRRRDTDDRDQFNFKIDHVINDRNHLSVSYSHEHETLANGFLPQQYPNSPGGNLTIGSAFYSINLVSTISSSMLNEFRAGSQRARYRFFAPWELGGDQTAIPRTPNGTSYLTVFNLITNPVATDND